MKIFVFGSGGMLGSTLCSFLQSQKTNDILVIPLTRQDMDVSKASFETLSQTLITANEGDVVVNCAGLIPQYAYGMCSSDDIFFAINSFFPQCLASFCNIRKLHLIHISTDCVFSGNGTGAYLESSTADETNVYGRSKFLGEPNITATILRTSIIGEEKRQHKSLLDWARTQRGKINGFANHRWNGVTCVTLSDIIHKIIKAGLWWKGVRHIFSPSTVSKYELLKYIATVYELKESELDILPVQCSQAIDKSLASDYRTCESFQIPPIEQQLAIARQFYIEQNK